MTVQKFYVPILADYEESAFIAPSGIFTTKDKALDSLIRSLIKGEYINIEKYAKDTGNDLDTLRQDDNFLDIVLSHKNDLHEFLTKYGPYYIEDWKYEIKEYVVDVEVNRYS